MQVKNKIIERLDESAKEFFTGCLTTIFLFAKHLRGYPIERT